MGVRVSEGTLYTTREQCFEGLEPIEQGIYQSIQASEVVHFDETGLRVNQRLWWLHVASTDGLTYYFAHPKRGQGAMNEMGILPEFAGKAIHDGWKSYQSYACAHFLCNAHHLRELQYIWEQYGQGWAFQMGLLLVSIHQAVEAAIVKQLTKAPAILILTKSYSTARNRGMVMPSERPKRARAVERAGFI